MRAARYRHPDPGSRARRRDARAADLPGRHSRRLARPARQPRPCGAGVAQEATQARVSASPWSSGRNGIATRRASWRMPAITSASADRALRTTRCSTPTSTSSHARACFGTVRHTRVGGLTPRVRPLRRSRALDVVPRRHGARTSSPLAHPADAAGLGARRAGASRGARLAVGASALLAPAHPPPSGGVTQPGQSTCCCSKRVRSRRAIWRSRFL